jgi:hypothetical protein
MEICCSLAAASRHLRLLPSLLIAHLLASAKEADELSEGLSAAQLSAAVIFPAQPWHF